MLYSGQYGGYSSVAERRSVAADVVGSKPTSRPKLPPPHPSSTAPSALPRRTPSAERDLPCPIASQLQPPARPLLSPPRPPHPASSPAPPAGPTPPGSPGFYPAKLPPSQKLPRTSTASQPHLRRSQSTPSAPCPPQRMLEGLARRHTLGDLPLQLQSPAAHHALQPPPSTAESSRRCSSSPRLSPFAPRRPPRPPSLPAPAQLQSRSRSRPGRDFLASPFPQRPEDRPAHRLRVPPRKSWFTPTRSTPRSARPQRRPLHRRNATISPTPEIHTARTHTCLPPAPFNERLHPRRARRPSPSRLHDLTKPTATSTPTSSHEDEPTGALNAIRLPRRSRRPSPGRRPRRRRAPRPQLMPTRTPEAPPAGLDLSALTSHTETFHPRRFLARRPPPDHRRQLPASAPTDLPAARGRSSIEVELRRPRIPHRHPGPLPLPTGSPPPVRRSRPMTVILRPRPRRLLVSSQYIVGNASKLWSAGDERRPHEHAQLRRHRGPLAHPLPLRPVV